MSNPCEATTLVRENEQRHYNFFRWLILGLLGTMLLFVAFRTFQFANLRAPEITRPPTGDLAPGIINIGGISNDARRVGLRVGEQVVGKADVDQDGNWIIQTGALPVGTYTVEAFAIDPEGGVGASSEPIAFTINDVIVVTTDPIDPIAGSGDGNGTGDNEGEDISAEFPSPTLAGVADLAENSSTILAGSGTPNSQINIELNGELIGSTTVGADGNWQIETDVLSTGEYSAIAYAVAPDGTQLAQSDSIRWIVGEVAFETPTLSLPEGDIQPNSPLTIAGTGTPDTTVEVFQNGISIGATVVDADGHWSLESVIDRYSTQFEAVGRTQESAVIGRTTPQTLLVPAASTALTFNDAPTIGEFSANAQNSSAPFSWSGTGEPRSLVELFASGISQPIGSATIADDGTWQINNNIDLPAGEYDLIVSQTLTDGTILSNSEPTHISVPSLLGDAGSTPVFVQIQGGRDPQSNVTIFGTATPDEQVEVMLDGQSVGSVTADSAGAWQISSPASVGEHTVSVNGSADSNFTVGDNGLGITITTIDTEGDTFFATGYAPSNATVELYLNDSLAGRVAADGNGAWLFEATGLAGANSLRASVIGSENTTQLNSFDTHFLIGNGQPLLAITSISGANGQAQFFGQAPANTQVQMMIDGHVVDVIVANANGEWDYGGSYADGQHQLVARLFNSTNGQITAVSSGHPFIIQGEATVGSDDGLLQLIFAEQPDGGVRTSARDIDGYLVDGPAIHLILDSSYSMRLNLSGDTRLDITNPDSRLHIARRTLQTVLASLPEGVPISIRAFGHIENNEQTTCQTALELSSQPLNRDHALSILSAIRPHYLTDTPLAESLAAATADLADINRKVILVLVTDGEENCGGDPQAAVQALIDTGLNFQLDVVGLAVGDEQAQALLRSLATLGGGRYFDAQSADALAAALDDSLLTPYQVLDDSGAIVATGIIGGEPLRLPPGRYRAEVLSAEPRSFNLVVRTGRTVLEMIE